MAFNDAPTTIWPSYTSDGTNITIPIAALPGLTSALAHTTTGDWRAIMLAIHNREFAYYNGLAAADRPLAYLPQAPTQSYLSSGSFAGKFRATYSVQIYLDAGTPSMAAEPA